MRKVICSLILLMVGLAATSPASALDPACEALQKITSDRATSSPAVAGAVIRSGTVICEAVAGRVSLDSAESASRHSRFYIASLAKPMTATTVLRLASAGEVSLSDPVTRYVPSLPSVWEKVTLRNLLRHDSGAPDHFDQLPASSIEGLTNEDVVEFLASRDALEFEPGSKWSYSNSGYVLLAKVVESVTGSTFGEWLGSSIFEPFDLRDAVVGRPASGVVRAYEHVPDSEQWTETPVLAETVGPGGVWASLADLEKWFLAIRKGEAVPPEYLAQAVAPTLTTTGKLTPYTIVFQVEDVARGLYYAGNFGRLGGNNHALVWLPDRDAAFILLSAGGETSFAPIIEVIRN